MFKNGMLLADYKDELIQTYGYPEELAMEIAIMAKSIVDYLGSEYESTVLSAIAKTKVIIADTYTKKGIRETVHDILDREGMNDDVIGDEKQSLVGIRNIDGIYKEKLHISYKDDEYYVDSVEKVAVINSGFIPNSPYFLGKLAGELLKAVKSQLCSYEINGNMLIIRQGIAVRTERLSHEGGKVTRNLISEVGVGLERGINTYDKMSIMRDSFYSDYDLESYTISTLIGGTSLDLLKLRDMVRVAQVTKDVTDLESVIDGNMPEGYLSFLGVVDEIYVLEKQREVVVDPDELIEINDKIEYVFHNKILPRMRKMKESMKLGVIQEGDSKMASF